MEIFKIIAVALIGAIVYLYLKSNNSELSGLVVIATGIIIIILLVDYIFAAVGFFAEMANRTGVKSELFTILIKVVAISYLTDFCESLCEDIGVKSLANKVSLAGRVIIFVTAIPVFENLFEITSSFL